MIQEVFSPRSRAASTKSMTATFIATARDSRNTRVESSTAMIRMRLMAEGPTIDSSTSAKISSGIDISTSTSRLSSWSNQPRKIATRIPSVPPIANDNSTVISAMPMVLRAPKNRRVSMSRPSWSVPNGCSRDHGR